MQLAFFGINDSACGLSISLLLLATNNKWKTTQRFDRKSNAIAIVATNSRIETKMTKIHFCRRQIPVNSNHLMLSMHRVHSNNCKRRSKWACYRRFFQCCFRSSVIQRIPRNLVQRSDAMDLFFILLKFLLLFIWSFLWFPLQQKTAQMHTISLPETSSIKQ